MRTQLGLNHDIDPIASFPLTLYNKWVISTSKSYVVSTRISIGFICPLLRESYLIEYKLPGIGEIRVEDV